jgi:acetyl-CoA carboxylase beta subunit
MAWFRKDKKPLTAQDRRDVPTDVFDKCKGCGEILYRERLAQNLNVCPNCGHHVRVSADAYVALLLDEGTFGELDGNLRAADALEFSDLKPYSARIAAAEAEGKREAVLSGTGELDGIEVALAVMDFDFIGGSMGSVVGEKIARVGHVALEGSYAGGHLLAHADGQDLDRPCQTARGGPSLRLDSDAPDHGGRDGVVRDAGGCEPGRARGADRLRRPAGH